jgi:hypothetical protein
MPSWSARGAWRVAPKHADVKPLERVAIADPDDRTLTLLVSLEEHWEAPGEASGRRQILRGLGGYLAKRGWPDEQIAAVARGLETARPEAARVALMLECARDARLTPEQSAGWSTLCEWSPDAAALIESIAKDPREPDGFMGVWSDTRAWWLEIWARRDERKRAERESATNDNAPSSEPFAPAAESSEAVRSVPLILRSRNGHVTLMWEGDDLGHQPIAEKNVRLRCRELGYDQSLIEFSDKNGKPRSVDALIEGSGAMYTHTAYAFANRVTQYDPANRGSVLIGYPRTALEARYDADADAWLRALGGRHYDRLAVWIASCDQRHIDRLSACLVLIGEKDIGKSMFSLACALLWGQTPPPLGLVVEKFNADLLRCPILVDEEAQLFGSKALSTKRFRALVQERSRSVELKGKERCELHGSMRAIVPCNGYSDLCFGDMGGPAVIDALRDRLLVIDALDRTAACAAPLAKLRHVADDYIVDLPRVAAHMAWLCETVALPAERFLGCGGDNAGGAILAGHVDEHVDLWETFRDWLDSAGACGAWSARPEGLCVEPSSLAQSLEHTGRGWSLRDVRAALAPFHKGAHRPRNDVRSGGDGVRRRLWVLDHMRIADALCLDLDGLERLAKRLSPEPDAPCRVRRFGKPGQR